MLNKPFKKGDYVYRVDVFQGIQLEQISDVVGLVDPYPVKIPYYKFTTKGKAVAINELPSLFHATKEVRDALVSLCGEDKVPALPCPSNIIMDKLLTTREFVIARVSNTTSNVNEVTHNELVIIIGKNHKGTDYMDNNGNYWKYVFAVDKHGYILHSLSSEEDLEEE